MAKQTWLRINLKSFTAETGWFPGENFRLFGITILETATNIDALVLLDIRFLKFTIISMMIDL